MKREHAYLMFKKMIMLAKEEIKEFTLNHRFEMEEKADKTVVTACDRHIDTILSDFAKQRGLAVVSEEGEKESGIVQGGNFLTIDPIDGSLGYIDHVNYALEQGGIDRFLKTDLGPRSDFCLLLGIVEGAQPTYGCCYHYVTDETILLDAASKEDCQVELSSRAHNYPNVCYIDQRAGEEIEQKIIKQTDVEAVLQATLGLKSLYTFLNQHENAITIHRVQHAGLWDILPAAVACKAFGGVVLDDTGKEAVYDKYVILPGKGATAIKGERFMYVKEDLKTIINPNIHHTYRN